MKKSILAAVLVLLTAGVACAAETAPSAESAAASARCDQMSPEEQAFAATLMEPNNRTVFCSQFTVEQRRMAMQLTGQLDVNGNAVTSDQAVQQVVLSGKASPSTTSKRKPGGACPLQQ